MRILITICCRGGSKGIPKKNIKPLNNIPLINYTINIAKKVTKKWNSKISLSTDNQEILQVARSQDLLTSYLRPSSLSNDSAGKVETISHLLKYEEKLALSKFDYILDLDVSSPLRNIKDIEKGFELIRLDKEMLSLFSVSKPSRNPYFNMVKLNESTGYFNVVNEQKKPFMSRQEAPKVYDMNASFYWYRRIFFDQNFKSQITEKSGIYLMDHICFDLDHMIDFKIMEYLIKNKELDFIL